MLLVWHRVPGLHYIPREAFWISRATRKTGRRGQWGGEMHISELKMKHKRWCSQTPLQELWVSMHNSEVTHNHHSPKSILHLSQTAFPITGNESPQVLLSEWYIPLSHNIKFYIFFPKALNLRMVGEILLRRKGLVFPKLRKGFKINWPTNKISFIAAPRGKSCMRKTIFYHGT